jgi:hypothetical protein
VFFGAIYSVPASHRERQLSLLVVQRHAQPIIFVLGDVFDFLAAGNLAGAAIKSIQFLERKCVIQAQHRRIVPTRLETLARRPAYPLSGRIGRHDFGMICLELLELIHQPVEFGIRNGRPVEHVITMLVRADLLAQPRDLFTKLAVVFSVDHYEAGPYRHAKFVRRTPII